MLEIKNFQAHIGEKQILKGINLKLEEVKLNGNDLSSDDYFLDQDNLHINFWF